jgi:hypothetical protein
MPKPIDPTGGGSRHRAKFKLQSIHVDELLNAAGMSGFLSVLEPPAESPPHLERLAGEMLAEYQARGEEVPGRYLEAIEQSDKTSSQEKGIPESGTPLSGTPQTGIPLSGAPQPAIPFSTARKPVIRQATLVQDGHSFGEQAVYQALWDNASPFDSDSRVISIGYRTLSGICHLTVNNCKANLLALSRKLAIKELTSHSPSQAKTYQIRNYNAILRLRRQAGLTHYVKTRGVTFVDPNTGSDITGIPESGTPLSIGARLPGIPESGTPEPITGTPDSGGSGIPVAATPSIDNYSRQFPASSSSPLPTPSLRSALEDIAPTADDDAIARLLYACFSRCPEATEEDVRDGVCLKSLHIRQGRVQNPLGFLLTAVPKLLEGEGLHRLRAWRRQRALQPASAEPSDLRGELLRLAADPASTEEDRGFVQRVLQDLERG